MALKKSAHLALIVLFISSLAFAQGPSKLRNEQPPIPTEQIIRKFAEKEKEFKTALEHISALNLERRLQDEELHLVTLLGNTRRED